MNFKELSILVETYAPNEWENFNSFPAIMNDIFSEVQSENTPEDYEALLDLRISEISNIQLAQDFTRFVDAINSRWSETHEENPHDYNIDGICNMYLNMYGSRLNNLKSSVRAALKMKGISKADSQIVDFIDAVADTIRDFISEVNSDTAIYKLADFISAQINDKEEKGADI